MKASGTVIVIDNNAQLLDNIRAKYPGDRVIPVFGDVGEWDKIQAIFESVCPLDVLVNNAAVYNKYEPLPTVSEESIDRWARN